MARPRHEARRCELTYTPLVAQWGTRRRAAALRTGAGRRAGRARRRNDAAELELHLDAMRALGRAAYCRDPHSMTDAIEWAAAHVTEAMDVAAATRLLDRARALQAHGSPAEPSGGGLQALRAIVTEIWDLSPSSPELQAKSFDSGIR